MLNLNSCIIQKHCNKQLSTQPSMTTARMKQSQTDTATPSGGRCDKKTTFKVGSRVVSSYKQQELTRKKSPKLIKTKTMRVRNTM